MSGDVVDLWLSVTETTAGSQLTSVVSVAATGKLALNISVAHKIVAEPAISPFHFCEMGD